VNLLFISRLYFVVYEGICERIKLVLILNIHNSLHVSRILLDSLCLLPGVLLEFPRTLILNNRSAVMEVCSRDIWPMSNVDVVK